MTTDKEAELAELRMKLHEAEKTTLQARIDALHAEERFRLNVPAAPVSKVPADDSAKIVAIVLGAILFLVAIAFTGNHFSKRGCEQAQTLFGTVTVCR